MNTLIEQSQKYVKFNRLLRNLKNDPQHLMITGNRGSGKMTVCNYVTQMNLKKSSDIIHFDEKEYKQLYMFIDGNILFIQLHNNTYSKNLVLSVIKDFSRNTLMDYQCKFIIIKSPWLLSEPFQLALRCIIDKIKCKFIFIQNDQTGIIEPLLSRLFHLHVNLDEDELIGFQIALQIHQGFINPSFTPKNYKELLQKVQQQPQIDEEISKNILKYTQKMNKKQCIQLHNNIQNQVHHAISINQEPQLIEKVSMYLVRHVKKDLIEPIIDLALINDMQQANGRQSVYHIQSFIDNVIIILLQDS